MSTVAGVERRIERREGFRVRIRHPDGRDVRGDREGLPQYPFERRAPDASTVKHWIETRFKPVFPGFEVEVLDGAGEHVHGGTRLGTVRDSYPD